LAAFLVAHRAENGACRLGMSCQFGVMVTEPPAPHCLHTNRQPTRDQG
jgi:hypothetical protein